MIEESVFKDTWTLLCDRFARQPSTPLMLAYYRSLSPKMSTDEFRAAAQRVFEEREFFPRPADFLDTVKPDTEAEALGEWERVQDVMRGLAKPDTLGPRGQHVVRLLGGVTKLRNTPVDDVQWVRKDFLAMYGDKASERAERELIAPTPEGNRLTAAIMGGRPRLLP